MEEYHDALQRAKRLAIARESALAGSESAMSAVKMDDLLIYARSVVWSMHSVKRVHAFLRVSSTGWHNRFSPTGRGRGTVPQGALILEHL